jgi:hypothetical protein
VMRSASIKRRSQFRIGHADLNSLYKASAWQASALGQNLDHGLTAESKSPGAGPGLCRMCRLSLALFGCGGWI